MTWESWTKLYISILMVRIIIPRQFKSKNEFIYAETLNIFPSQPMHVEPSNKGGMSLALPSSTSSKRPSGQSMEIGNPRSNTSYMLHPENEIKEKETKAKKGTNSCTVKEGPKKPDAKTLRRLAQNREAARKSRLRKKAYVQQLEQSRIRLSQLEQELQRARPQGVFFSGGSLFDEQGQSTHAFNNFSSDAAIFDMEHARWLEEHHRLTCELRAVVQEQLPEHEVALYVENCLSHYDEMMNLKSAIIKGDVFHLISGMWKTPAERFFMWMGGFRPSDLIKILISHIEPLSEQQILGISSLQQSIQEAEEALSRGLEALYHSISDTIASDALRCTSNMASYMSQMAIAINNLSTLEGYLRQADGLRQQTLHRLHQILTVHQAALCFLAIAEYFHRLRALSSLWLARPRLE